MSALVDYGSSDEELEENSNARPATKTSNKATHEAIESSQPSSHDAHTVNAVPSGSDNMNGVAIGPSKDSNTISAPQSPYALNRAAIRNLTLPAIPNFEIPPSPPGSPPPGMEKKFEHFLDLKKQGVHFNEKLAKSSALKNPGLLQKLMEFAGVDEEDQYNTTLSEDAWNPKGFPVWAFKEELAKSQQEMTMKKEAERSLLQRESIDFVSATNDGESLKDGAPGTIVSTRGARTSAAERVMAGLDRGRVGSPHGDSGNNRRDAERRVSRLDATRSMMGPRSPKRRKRSRSG